MNALARMVNEDYEPAEADDAVIAVLKAEGRANPYLIREETDLDRQRINAALQRLCAAGWVSKRTRGLYDFVDDPRDTDSERDWRDQLRAELRAMDVPEARRDDVERLAKLLRTEGRLGYSFAVDEREVVSEWEWQQSKDYLAATSLVERPNQRTWRWVGPD